jgi:hypothetical protein
VQPGPADKTHTARRGTAWPHPRRAYGILRLKQGAGLERVRIEIFGPKTGTTLRVPTFPAPYADRNATVDDVPGVFRAGLARMTGGWDVARRYVQRDDFFSFDWLDGDFVFSE